MAELRLLTRPFALCFVANLLQGLAFNLFLHFPGYLKQLGADELQIGFISALTAVAAIALRPPTGRAMDRRGRRVVILVGGVANVVAVSLYLTISVDRALALRGAHRARGGRGAALLVALHLRGGPGARRAAHPGARAVRRLGDAADLAGGDARRLGDPAPRLPGALRHLARARRRLAALLAAAARSAAAPRGDRASARLPRRARPARPAAALVHGHDLLGGAHRVLRLHQDLRRRERHRDGRWLLHGLHGGGAGAARVLRLAAGPPRAEARAGTSAARAGGRLPRPRTGARALPTSRSRASSAASGTASPSRSSSASS